MSSLLHVHLRSAIWLLTLLITILLVGIAQYWLGHLLEADSTNILSVDNDTFTSFSSFEDERQFQEPIQVSEILPNCGIQAECPTNTFPVHIYTGQDKDDQPKLCIHGKYIIGGGRGLNAAIIESNRLNIVSVQNFDLYSQNSTALEGWLVNQVHDGDIIIAFTFDEASKELSKKAKTALYKLGSGKIQDLQFRSQWYMISQKGIKGFTSLERLTFAKNDHWGEVIDERICVPKRIPSVTVTPDPYPRKNSLRESLCRDSSVLQCSNFCNALTRHEALTPALLTNRSLIGNPVYSSPVVVAAMRTETSSLILTLETLLHQPGIHAPSVLVLINQTANPDAAMIVNLFSFQPIPVDSTTTNDYIYVGIQTAKERFPNKKYVIIIEDGVLLSPDFLFYMAQMVSVLEKDRSVIAISAWNPYGYENVSSNPHLTFRADDYPSLAFIMSFHTFSTTRFPSCCTLKPVDGVGPGEGGIVYPEVSRVLKRPLAVLRGQEKVENVLPLASFPRTTNMDAEVWIEQPESMVLETYNQLIEAVVNQSKEIYVSSENCQQGFDPDILVHHLSEQLFVVLYYQESECGVHNRLRTLAKCFGLHMLPKEKPRGLYKGTFRFSYGGKHIILVESSSPFYKTKIV